MSTELSEWDMSIMHMALNNAMRNVGSTGENPSVSAIIVKDHKIISIANTGLFGTPHGEALAIQQLEGQDIKGSHLYVTLEPCTMFAKNPPCVNKILEAQISKVYIAMLDPTANQKGQGVAILKDHNVEVVLGVLEEKAKEVIKGFYKRILYNLPYTTLKIATSLDSKIAVIPTKREMITNKYFKKYTHLLRARNDAILVGINTALLDNPELTCRLVENQDYQSPLIRIVIDPNLALNPACCLVETANMINKLWIICSAEIMNSDVYKRFMEMEHISLILIDEEALFIGHERRYNINFQVVLNELAQKGINNLLVEGGAQTSKLLYEQNLFDEFILARNNSFLGFGKSMVGEEKISVEKDRLKLIHDFHLGDNHISHYKNIDKII